MAQMAAKSVQLRFLLCACMDVCIKSIAPNPSNQSIIGIQDGYAIHMEIRQEVVCLIAKRRQLLLDIQC